MYLLFFHFKLRLLFFCVIVVSVELYEWHEPYLVVKMVVDVDALIYLGAVTYQVVRGLWGIATCVKIIFTDGGIIRAQRSLGPEPFLTNWKFKLKPKSKLNFSFNLNTNFNLGMVHSKESLQLTLAMQQVSPQLSCNLGCDIWGLIWCHGCLNDDGGSFCEAADQQRMLLANLLSYWPSSSWGYPTLTKYEVKSMLDPVGLGPYKTYSHRG